MSELARVVALRRVSARATPAEVVATDAECLAVARRLGIAAVAALRCGFELRAVPGGRVAADGVLEARVTQQSVVSLEPFETVIREAFEVVFVPVDELAGEHDPLDLDAPDELPIEGDGIDLGEAALQQLALALDPYPRAPGESAAGTGQAAQGPFAALEALRKKLS